MEANDLTLRAARGAEAEEILRFLRAGFETFRAWSPGWDPPEFDADAVLATEWVLNRPETWFVIAEDAAGQAGQCGFHQGHEQRMMRGAPIPGLAHFWQLFVRPDLWGSGLAARLHDAALAEIRARKYERARLFTPAGHARARRFYERHGWRASGRALGEGLGTPPMEMVEYVREVARKRNFP